ncbi:hypothetical protein DFQ29_009794 [Apophysomyces sp. BC1021]|nr:hypothetical protein DFQ29_009794 [Apophysomyces sp. BC1021]
MALHPYCIEVGAYYKTKVIQVEFTRIYDKKLLTMEAQALEETKQLGYNNGILASIAGAKGFKIKLENTDQSWSPRVTKPANDLKNQADRSSNTSTDEWLGKRDALDSMSMIASAKTAPLLEQLSREKPWDCVASTVMLRIVIHPGSRGSKPGWPGCTLRHRQLEEHSRSFSQPVCCRAVFIAKRPSRYVAGFKIDFRFIFDANGAEYDVGAGEAARSNSDVGKMHKDLGKLLREGKDVVDDHLTNAFDTETVRKAGAPSIQISGLHAELSRLKYLLSFGS